MLQRKAEKVKIRNLRTKRILGNQRMLQFHFCFNEDHLKIFFLIGPGFNGKLFNLFLHECLQLKKTLHTILFSFFV